MKSMTLRPVLGTIVTVASLVLLYLALVVPDTVVRHKTGAWVPGAYLRVPMELIVAGAVVLALPGRWRKPVAALFGFGFGVIAVLKVANMGFLLVLGRRFNPVLDVTLFKDGYNAFTETDGKTKANLAVAGAILLALAVLSLATLAAVRLATVTARHAQPTRRALVALSAVWLALALSGVSLFPNNPVASDSAAALAKSTAKQVPAAIRDQRQFAEASRNDPFRSVAPADRVAGLKGKDVILGVVESYGRSSLEDPGMSAIVTPMLKADEAKLAAAGFSAKSGFLTSSTYGGGSWLGHSTFQTGLWIDSQPRYRQVTAGDRITLTSTFHDAGWHTVGMEPGNTTAWPEASFYKYDTVYDSRNLAYRGPRFGWSRMPDQYLLSQFQQNVYAKRTGPLMAELTFTSSHEPWTPLPQTVDWAAVGDGSVYGPMAKQGPSRGTLWQDATATQAAYAKSIAYSVDNFITWATTYGDPNLVLVMFGDHQPVSLVSGNGASHDVPVTIIAHDKRVLDRIAGWSWQDGLKPAPDAPLWRMDEFRDRFFTAFGTQSTVALGKAH
ncbi:sulfatase [Actinoplanes sp. TBRC 11911]|uniref:sulfatase-like hydrolase/transferase n=1 Tax=Actinoplanes sp. TBRC 11911 TaxID=2729386 RepID=UPI00145EDFED|nr:sulfatase-like hydrolase/transferase [Actinoplanes sp. TBRC 11911]NMO54783.1 sulfatase [Actinoplanes sp. TBRC 11911]